MKHICQLLFALFLYLPFSVNAQSVAVSDFDRQDTRDMDFEIIGKMNSNILVYKNIRSNHKISIYDEDLVTLKLESAPRLLHIKRVLQAGQDDALQIAVRNAGPVRQKNHADRQRPKPPGEASRKPKFR